MGRKIFLYICKRGDQARPRQGCQLRLLPRQGRQFRLLPRWGRQLHLLPHWGRQLLPISFSLVVSAFHL